VQTLLDGARPAWRWEPTLLEVEGEHAWAYTGMALRVKLLLGMGPQRTWRVARLVRRAGVPLLPHARAPQGGTPVERRRFLVQGAAVLVGAALVGKFSPQLAAYAAAPKALPALTPVPPTDPMIGTLQHVQAVQSAARHFGAPNWAAVQKAQAADQTVYLIPYAMSGQLTVLVVGDPATGQQTTSLVVQQAPEDQHAQRVTWRTADGQILGATVFRAGQVTTTPHPGTVSPDFNLGCFLECTGGNAEFCIEPCVECAAFFGPFNPACYVCAACAGISAFPCIRKCNY